MSETSTTPEIMLPSRVNELKAQLTTPGSIWLDSSLSLGSKGKKSFLLQNPILEIILGENLGLIGCAPEQIKCTSIDQMLEQLDQLWSDHSLFSAGYFGYESTLPLLGLSSTIPATSDLDVLPQARFLFYDRSGTEEVDPAHMSDIEPWEKQSDQERSQLIGWPKQSEYESEVRIIKDHIREGDIYQANYTSRFIIDSDCDPLAAYFRLRHLNPASYSAYLNFGDYQMLSSSPERMFLRLGDTVITSPIKGTIARGTNKEQTARNLETLLSSEKDRAELLMIVDLARNDLGRVARTGSVEVKQLFKSELYSSVIHLVSDVSARIDPDLPTSSLVRTLLPGGSISGAPKKRAVEILQQRESHRRNIYTGCIGYVHGDEAEFNIAIRTILHQHSEYHVHAGGGIVADSSPSAEYEEMRLKAANLLRAVGLTDREIRS